MERTRKKGGTSVSSVYVTHGFVNTGEGEYAAISKPAEAILSLLKSSGRMKYSVDLECDWLFDASGDFQPHYVKKMLHLSNEECVEQIMKIGNPSNPEDVSLAETLVRNGKKFSVDNILKLGNPLNKWQSTLGHLMATKGYEFTRSEIKKLGNPKDSSGQGIGDIMVSHGYFFSDFDRRILNIKAHVRGKQI